MIAPSAAKRNPYVNPDLRVNDRVRIVCEVSNCHGVSGVVFEIGTNGYAIVDLPKGTELDRENIKVNAILSGWKKVEGKPRPQGDPQRFPIGWLVSSGSVDDSYWFGGEKPPVKKKRTPKKRAKSTAKGEPAGRTRDRAQTSLFDEEPVKPRTPRKKKRT